MTPHRAAILRELGLAPLWRLRGTAEATAPDSETAVVTDVPAAATPPVANAGRGTPVPEAPRTRREAVPMPWSTPAPEPVPTPTPQAAPAHDAVRIPLSPSHIAVLDWPALEENIHACRACVLCERRIQAVPGVGDRSARWMLVGEGPGAEEDRRGEPFVGPAGKLLDNMLAALNLKRDKDVYIANAVKCRPPHNRTPEAAEIATCAPFLDRQIALVQPRLLVALGRPAALALLGREVSISAARGKRFEYKGVTLIVTYHPAYLLRNPLDKGKAWEDLCFARRLMAQEAR
jgi:DNA polymerase